MSAVPDSAGDMERPPILQVDSTRYYRFDVERIMRDFGDDIRRDMEEYNIDLDEALRGTFDELCGTWADRDHVDGNYIWLEDADSDLSFHDWNKILAASDTSDAPKLTSGSSAGSGVGDTEVVVCYCGGGDIHEWKPVGSGASMRILQCPDHEPVRKPRGVGDNTE